MAATPEKTAIAIQAWPDEYVLLEGMSWATYESILKELEGRRRFRITYDRGQLEIMTTSPGHERYKKYIARLETMTEELGIEIASGGQIMFRDELVEKGLEPDDCYWVENEARVRHLARRKKKFDLEKDPPPDLAIEVAVSRSALDRMGIYASLGVREVWRWTKESRLVFLVRNKARGYREVARSGRFPFLAPADLVPFLASVTTMGETTWIRGFRKWVRDELQPRSGLSASGD